MQSAWGGWNTSVTENKLRCTGWHQIESLLHSQRSCRTVTSQIEIRYSMQLHMHCTELNTSKTRDIRRYLHKILHCTEWHQIESMLYSQRSCRTVTSQIEIRHSMQLHMYCTELNTSKTRDIRRYLHKTLHCMYRVTSNREHALLSTKL